MPHFFPPTDGIPLGHIFVSHSHTHTLGGVNSVYNYHYPCKPFSSDGAMEAEHLPSARLISVLLHFRVAPSLTLDGATYWQLLVTVQKRADFDQEVLHLHYSKG